MLVNATNYYSKIEMQSELIYHRNIPVVFIIKIRTQKITMIMLKCTNESRHQSHSVLILKIKWIGPQ